MSNISKTDIQKIETTANDFLSDRLTLGIGFQSWKYDSYELYGIVLGMFLTQDPFSFERPIEIKNNQNLLSLLDFIQCVSEGYDSLPYHSFLHAVDVTYTFYFMLETMEINRNYLHLHKIHVIAALIAAIGHDVLHPGFNNLFQTNAQTPVSKKYNNKSILENQSIDHIKALLDIYPIIEDLSFSDIPPNIHQIGLKTYMLDVIYELIITTDMAFHFSLMEDINRFIELRVELRDSKDAVNNSKLFDKGLNILNLSSEKLTDFKNQSIDEGFSSVHVSNMIGVQENLPRDSSLHENLGSGDLKIHCDESFEKYLEESAFPQEDYVAAFETTELSDTEKRLIIKSLLHAADISNPAKPFIISQYWSDKVVKEFFSQGDEEQRLKLNLSPNMDRESTSPSQLLLDFIDYIVHPLFRNIHSLFPMFSIFIDIISQNRARAESEIIQNKTERQVNTIKKLSHVRQIIKNENPVIKGRRLSMAAGTIELPEYSALPSSPRSPGQVFARRRDPSSPSSRKITSLYENLKGGVTLSWESVSQVDCGLVEEKAMTRSNMDVSLSPFKNNPFNDDQKNS